MPGFETPADNESNDAIVFGYQTGLFLKEFAQVNKAIKVIAHFHEVSPLLSPLSSFISSFLFSPPP